MKLGLHVINSTPAVTRIADKVSLLKGVTSASIPALVKAQRAGATTIYRSWFSEQEQRNILNMDSLKDGARLVKDRILDELGDVRPDYVEALNEVAQSMSERPSLNDHMVFMDEFITVMHACHIKVAGFSFSWGGVEYDNLTALAYEDWCGVDALAIHEYMSGPIGAGTVYGGIRTLDLLKSACEDANRPMPKVFITECGVGRLGAPYHGWKTDGLTGAQYAGKLRMWRNRVSRLYPMAEGACVFTSGVRFQDVPPLQGWEWDDYNIDGVEDVEALLTKGC